MALQALRHRARLAIARQVATRPLSSTATTATKEKSDAPSSNTSPPPATSSSWQDDLYKLWEQASGDAELRALKDQVTTASLEFDQAVTSVAQQRRLVEKCQQEHEKAYQRHASLLMRREQWTPEEAAMFVDITSQEVTARQTLQDARQELLTLEEATSKLQQVYMDALRTKYQEEQSWQDKWRVLGTFGTWSLIGLNSLVFLLSQALFYRREANRLVDIENLIKSHTIVAAEEESKNTTSGVEEGLVVVNDTDTEEDVALGKSGMDEKPSADTRTSVTEETTESDQGDNHWWTRMKRIKHELANNLHVPSAAAGAVASASVCVIVGLVLNRR